MRTKLIGAALIRSASTGAPAVVQQAYYDTPPYRYAPPYYRPYDVPPGNYPPRDTDEYWNEVNHRFSGREPSRVGGDSPSLNPPGN